MKPSMVRDMRKWVLLLAVSALALAPACSATPSPAPADTFEPVASAAAVTAKVLIPNSIPSQIDYKDVMARLNESLKAKGQHVEFELRSVSYNADGSNTYSAQAREELTAGNPAADAYAFGLDESESFHEGGLTRDVTALVRQYAPLYHSQYAAMFGDALTGIPVGIYGRPVWFKAAVVLRKDYLEAGSALRTTEDLFAFLDNDIVAPKNYRCLLADPESLVSQWGLEQGYYNLSPFGLYGYMYAAIDDPACAPVPLESIPGFEGFMKKLMSYYQNDALSSNFYTVYSREPVGFVKNLGDYYISNPFSWLGWIPGEFTAQVFTPELPSLFSDPVYVEELAIPASAPEANAAEVARFVEWYNDSQENYDAVLYGAAGVDFGASGARLVPMKDGKPQDMESILQMQGLFFTWPGASVLSNTDYFRLPASAPANLEELFDEGRRTGRRFEANRFLKTDRKTFDALEKLGPGIGDIRNARNDALNGLIYGSPPTYTDSTYAACMETLGKVRTDLLAADYRRLIDSLRNAEGK
jgi:hypothetical protein